MAKCKAVTLLAAKGLKIISIDFYHLQTTVRSKTCDKMQQYYADSWALKMHRTEIARNPLRDCRGRNLEDARNGKCKEIRLLLPQSTQ